MIKKSRKSVDDLKNKTAPGELAMVHAFLNTWDLAGPRERFDTPERMRRWFAKRSLIGSAVTITTAQFTRTIAVRHGLRLVLAAAGHGCPPDRKALRYLNEAAEKITFVIKFEQDGMPALLAADSGFEAAIARILAVVRTSVLNGNWRRLKICRNPDCERAFFDKSKNQSAVWCTTQGCGNRLNARAFRARS